MVDITKYPYFSCKKVVDALMEPISSQAEVTMVGFSRKFPSGDRFIICLNKGQMSDYDSREIEAQFETDCSLFESGFHMWDYLLGDPSGIYDLTRFLLCNGKYIWVYC